MSSDDPGSIILQLVLICLLTLINAFFASAELAVISINRTKTMQLAADGNKKAIKLLKLADEPTSFLSTIQVGITLAGFFSSATAATGISSRLETVFIAWGVPFSDTVAVVLVTILLSYFTLVFGELFPKRMAMARAEKVALAAAGPILALRTALSPFVKLLSLSTSLLMKLAGLGQENVEEKLTREEIRSILKTGQEEGLINREEREMINGVFEINKRDADEIMTPRTEVYCINIERPLAEYLDEMLEENYTRVPVYENDADNIIGILHMKDFLVSAKQVGFENVDMRSLLRAPYFVPESKSVDALFFELKNNRNHIAVLVDEYGGFSGIVTIEDIIEEIMGEIDDEFDDRTVEIRQLDANTYIVDGLLPLDELNEQLGLELEEGDDYDTVGGFVIDRLGYLPLDGETPSVEIDDKVFKIEKMCDKRAELIKIHVPPREEKVQ